MTRNKATLFRYGRETAEVLLGGGAQRVWRLDTREDSNDRGMFVTTPDERWRRRPRRLVHYMFAGGLRQHRWSAADDQQIARRRLAIRIMLAMLAAWFIFRWLPVE